MPIMTNKRQQTICVTPLLTLLLRVVGDCGYLRKQVLKTSKGVSPSRVRISPPPPSASRRAGAGAAGRLRFGEINEPKTCFADEPTDKV